MELKKEKLLDHAIFMLLEARKKCYNKEGLIAGTRIEIAIKELNIIIKHLNTLETYPTVDKLKELNII